MTTATIRLPRAKRDDRGAHQTQIVMTTATIWVLQRLKPMTTMTTARQRARGFQSAMATA
jgi:hypothetical protein